MKAVFVGGGAHRLLGILRGALAEPGIFENGEINLYDLDVSRAEAMGRMVMKTPEYAKVRCKVTWGTTLAQALDGADMVAVILMAGSAKTFELGNQTCYAHGFVPSDNLSPNGAFLAVKGAPILLNLARLMEQYCPQAWLVDFANPIAVLTAMVSNHTRIRAIGVCAGYTNHQWDLSRVFGKDEQGAQFDVEVAGVNHLSCIVKGTVCGRELFKSLDHRLANGWRMPKLQASWPKAYHQAIPQGIRDLIRFYRDLGVLIFSTEGDGMLHLDYETVLARHLKRFKPLSAKQIDRRLRAHAAGRRKADDNFRAHLSRDLNSKFWRDGWRDLQAAWSKRQDRDIFVEVLRGLSGAKRVKVVASSLNRGAVEGFSDRTVLEYSQIIENGGIRPVGRYKVPAVVHGIIASLASHQTLLGDALASEDPRMLAQALLCYPVRPFSKSARSLWKDLARINRDEMATALRTVDQFL